MRGQTDLKPNANHLKIEMEKSQNKLEGLWSWE